MKLKYHGMAVDAVEAVVYVFAGLPRRIPFVTWLQRRRLKILAVKRNPPDPDLRHFKSIFDDLLTGLFRAAGLLTLAAASATGLGYGHAGDGRDAPEFTRFFLLLADVGQSSLLWLAGGAASIWLGRFVLRHFIIVGRTPTFAAVMAVILLPGFAVSGIMNGSERPLRMVGGWSELDLFLRCNTQDRLSRRKEANYEIFAECQKWMTEQGSSQRGQSPSGKTSVPDNPKGGV